MTQQDLQFDEITLAREAVRKVLLSRWIPIHELPQAVYQETGKWFSETGLSARVRDLRKAVYGGLPVAKRRCAGKSYYEYRVMA